MIRFSLCCANDHRFESWFASGDAYDTLSKRGMVSCPVCGDGAVTKALMAPRVQTSDTPQTGGETDLALSGPVGDPAHAAIARLRRMIEENSEDVGDQFAREARAIHAGEKPERSIYGQARGDEARKLIEDGIPVAPLPFIPTRKTN